MAEIREALSLSADVPQCRFPVTVLLREKGACPTGFEYITDSIGTNTTNEGSQKTYTDTLTSQTGTSTNSHAEDAQRDVEADLLQHECNEPSLEDLFGCFDA